MATVYTYMAALALCAFIIPISAKDYTVGDSSGWTNGYDYSTWTQGKTFVVGDNLIFSYDNSLHSVYEVPSQSYQSCSTSGPLNLDTNSGSTTISLRSAGTYNFICGTASHCNSGMKMSITVAASGSPTTPSSSTPTSSTTTTSTKSSGNSVQAPLIGGSIVAAIVAMLA